MKYQIVSIEREETDVKEAFIERPGTEYYFWPARKAPLPIHYIPQPAPPSYAHTVIHSECLSIITAFSATNTHLLRHLHR